MLDLYRRHTPDCKHAKDGRTWNRCKCPIWAAGDIEGAPLRQSTRTRDWSRAAKRIQEWERAKDKPRYSPKVDKAIDVYLADCAARNLAPNTIASYKIILSHLAKFAGAAARVDEIDLDKLTEFRGIRKIEPSTGVKELTAVRAFCGFCVLRKWLSENYAKLVRPPKVDRCPTLPFERAEIAKILEACGRITTDNPALVETVRDRARAAILTLMYSGLRISDLTKLERSTVDLQSGKMFLRVMKTHERLGMTLHASAVAALASLPDHGPYFFWTGNGDLVTAIKNMRRTIDRVLKLAGVDGHPHRFRDTFSVGLLEQGEDIRTVQLLLGHKSLKTTEKHYAPFVRSFQRILDAATAKLDFTTPESGTILVQGPNGQQNVND